MMIKKARWLPSARLLTPALMLLQLGFSPLQAAPANAMAEELSQLIEQGRHQEAYVLAENNLLEHEGDPEFDFYYGLAALESGQPDKAVFALERVAYYYPQQPRFKLELARAYYMSNNLTTAESLFRQVLATEPEQNVQANINAFLAVIEERENNLQGSFSWHLDSRIGSDSNINSATELGVISTPIGDVELNPTGQRMEDVFYDLGGGFTYRHPLDKNRNLNLSANFNQHDNHDSDQFDLQTLSLEGSYSINRGNHRFNHALRVQKVTLDGEGFQHSTSAMSSWQRSGSDGWSQALTGALTAVRYDNAPGSSRNELRDVNQMLLSAVLGKMSGRFLHQVSLYGGAEHSLRARGRHNAQRFYGLSFLQRFQLSAQHLPFLRLSLHESDNKAANPVFNVAREDTTVSGSLGWLWQFNRDLSINTDLTYTDNDSNIELYAYDRLKYQAGIRYQF